MDLKAIKKVNIGDQVYDQMRNQIVSGAWSPGEKIPSENQLIEVFGVSRGTVRQSIQKLVAIGLLETRRGEGSYVRNLGLENYFQGLIPASCLSEDDLKEVFDFRTLFECGVAEMAAEHATEEQIRKLELNFEQMVQYAGKLDKYIAIDYEFHFLLGECTHNTLVTQMYKTIEEILVLAMERITDYIGYEHGLKCHKLLLDAIKNHNSMEAREAMRYHVKENAVFYAQITK